MTTHRGGVGSGIVKKKTCFRRLKRFCTVKAITSKSLYTFRIPVVTFIPRTGISIRALFPNRPFATRTRVSPGRRRGKPLAPAARPSVQFMHQGNPKIVHALTGLSLQSANPSFKDAPVSGHGLPVCGKAFRFPCTQWKATVRIGMHASSTFASQYPQWNRRVSLQTPGSYVYL